MLIAILVVLILLSGYYLYKHTRKPTDPSLYTRLGGAFSIAAVINDFSDALVENPIVGKGSKNPYLKDWHQNKLDRLPGLKFMRTLWVCSLSGGPFKYSPTKPGKCPFSLENAHNNLQISSAEFDEVARELAKSLDKFAVPPREKSEVLAAFNAHKSEVTMGYNIAHNLPVNAIC